MMIEQLRHARDEISAAFQSLGGRDLIEDIDDCRCGHCNRIVGPGNVNALLLAGKNALDDLIEEIEHHAHRTDLLLGAEPETV